MRIFSVAAVFSDNMVLQRNRFISFFGDADDDFSVTVTLFNENGKILSQNKAASHDGKWKVKLEPQSA